MWKKIGLAAALLGIILYSLNDLAPGASAYAPQLYRFRAEKNRAFRLSPDSPLSAAQKAQFDSLRYYPLGDEGSRPTGHLRRIPRPDAVDLPMSDGQTEKYVRFGVVEFAAADPVPSPPQHLTLYRKATGNDSTLFIPFTDLTNGHDTYGGGRYLDVPLPAPDATTIELDFNRAYNPYCAYNNAYSCPVPPAENRLAVPIRAGEKAFHD